MIKISGFKSVLHDGLSFDLGNQEFLKGIEEVIQEPLYISDIEDYACDLKLIFIASGGSEGLFLEEFNKLKPPYYLLTSGTNNSLAASLEILTYLKSNGYDGEILHGSKEYIGKRIIELKDKNKEKVLSGTRIGVFGRPSDWLIASIPEYKRCMDKLGVEFVDIPLSKIEDQYNRVDFMTHTYTGFNKEELNKAYKLYSVIRDISNKEHIHALTIRCFDLLTSLKTTGCLSLSLLNDNGIVSSCEGDIMALISMLIIKKYANAFAFQANPSQMNLEKNTILFAHCTIPISMCKEYSFATHFESGIGLAVKGELKEEEVTIFRLSKDFKNYFLSTGKIIRNLSLPNICRTQIEVQLDENIDTILKNPSGNHHMICYGNHKKEIEEVLKKIL